MPSWWHCLVDRVLCHLGLPRHDDLFCPSREIRRSSEKWLAHHPCAGNEPHHLLLQTILHQSLAAGRDEMTSSFLLGWTSAAQCWSEPISACSLWQTMVDGHNSMTVITNPTQQRASNNSNTTKEDSFLKHLKFFLTHTTPLTVYNKKASIRWQDSANRQFQAGLRGDVGL